MSSSGLDSFLYERNPQKKLESTPISNNNSLDNYIKDMPQIAKMNDRLMASK